jgi:hypothetical protein
MEKFIAWFKGVPWKQTITGLKVGLAALGPTLISLAPMLGYQPTEVEKIIAGATTILGVVLTLMERTSAAMVKDAKDIQGVQVHVDTQDSNTPASVVKLATGPTPDVFPMIGGPRVPSEHEDAAGVAEPTLKESPKV